MAVLFVSIPGYQLNLGIALLENADQREELARLNLQAGCKAKLATAYTSAMEYYKIGLNLLSGNGWQQYELALAMHEETAEAAYLSGDFEQMVHLTHIVHQQARSLSDQIKVYEINIQACIAQNQPVEAVKTALQVLNLLGIKISEHPNQKNILSSLLATKINLLGHSVESLADLPVMTVPDKLKAAQILSKAVSAAYIGKPDLLPLLVFSNVNLFVKYGNSSLAAFAYAWYGLILCGVLIDIKQGYQFGELALSLLEKFNAKVIKSRTFFIVYCFIKHWQVHLKETLNPLLESYQIGLESGDIEYASWSAHVYCQHRYWTGGNLSELEPQIKFYCEAIGNLKQETALNYNKIFYQTVLNLLGQSNDIFCLEGHAFSEAVTVPIQQASHDKTGLFLVYLNKAYLCYLLANYSQASQNLELAQNYIDGATALYTVVVFNFYDSLSKLALASKVSKIERKQLLNKVKINQKKLKKWAHYAPTNHLHKYHLVEAERYRVLSSWADAMIFYDNAITGARANEYLNEEALANELTAKFYLEWGKEKVATAYMQEAYYCYARWGANVKTSDLEKRYPQMLQPILQQKQHRFNHNETISTITKSLYTINQSTTSNTSISEALDFATILKASQNLSGEIYIDKLLTCLLNTIIECGGASSSALILLWDNELRVEAVAKLGQKPIILQACSIENSSDVPASLIYSVKRSLQTVVINDATKENFLLADPYIIQQQPKSLLCTPILNQGKLLGILYLENNLAIGAFTKERVEILNLLCTQAAISLENARLYQKSQNYAQQLEDSLASLQEKARLTAFRADVDTILTQENSLQVTLQRCTEVIVQHLDAAFARIWTLNSSQQILELQASAGMYTHINGSHSQISVGKFKIGLIAQERKPHLTNQVLEDSRISNREWAKREGMVAFAGYPLIVDGQLVGVLAMFARQILSESVLESLEFAASEIALGIKRKLSEEALLQSETQLRQKTTELENVLHQLQQTQTQLVQNEKMSSLGNLVAGVAHEVNNPIGFLKGSLNNAQEYVKDLLEYIQCIQQHHPQLGRNVNDFAEEVDLEFIAEDLPKLIASMKGATARIQDISTSLRTFSRADTAEKVACNIHEGIDSTLLILKYRLKANEFRPAIEVIKAYGKLPPVKCFLGQLNQVFMNILANAIDAIDEQSQKYSFDELKANPKQITITTEVLQTENLAVIRIKDNGSGMSEAVKAKIFDHLFTTKGVGKGTGLGLAIAHQIVEQTHAGKIICNSAPNIGTEFVIKLPLI